MSLGHLRGVTSTGEINVIFRSAEKAKKATTRVFEPIVISSDDEDDDEDDDDENNEATPVAKPRARRYVPSPLLRCRNERNVHFR